jgi:hypothetical protein
MASGGGVPKQALLAEKLAVIAAILAVSGFGGCLWK